MRARAGGNPEDLRHSGLVSIAAGQDSLDIIGLVSYSFKVDKMIYQTINNEKSSIKY